MKRPQKFGKQEQNAEYQPVNQGVDGSDWLEEPHISMPERSDACLLIETALVLIIAVLAVKCINFRPISEVSWLLGPLILVIAAFVPTKIRHRKFADFGLTRRQIPKDFVVLFRTCLAVFPLAFFGLWVLESYGIGLSRPSAIPQEQGWFGLLFYQFMYVALAEEVFFRGYLQCNILKLAQPITDRRLWVKKWISIVLSAACFAFAHVIVQGRITSILTFLPGLVLGWLFIRTGSLLAPVLFHGLANICYIIIVGMFLS